MLGQNGLDFAFSEGADVFPLFPTIKNPLWIGKINFLSEPSMPTMNLCFKSKVYGKYRIIFCF